MQVWHRTYGRLGLSRNSPWGQREACHDISSSAGSFMFQKSSWAPKQDHQPSLLSDQPGSTTGRNQVSSWIAGGFRWSYNHAPQCYGQPCLVPTSCSRNVQLHHKVFSSCVQLSLIAASHFIWQLYLVGLNSMFRCAVNAVVSRTPWPHPTGYSGSSPRLLPGKQWHHRVCDRPSQTKPLPCLGPDWFPNPATATSRTWSQLNLALVQPCSI